MAPHSNTLAWKIPWTEEPGRLQSMGSQRVGHDWATSLSLLVSNLLLCRFSQMTFTRLREFPLIPSLLRDFPPHPQNQGWIMDFAHNQFLHPLVWSHSFIFCLLIWWATLIAFEMLNNSCVSKRNCTWSQWEILWLSKKVEDVPEYSWLIKKVTKGIA